MKLNENAQAGPAGMASAAAAAMPPMNAAAKNKKG
jgi:hypothetical protein